MLQNTPHRVPTDPHCRQSIVVIINFDEVPMFVLPDDFSTVVNFDHLKAVHGSGNANKSRCTVVVGIALSQYDGKTVSRVLEPFIIFKGASATDRRTALTEVRDASDSACQPHGWMCTSLMQKVARHFLRQNILSQEDAYVVLTYDNFRAHEWLEKRPADTRGYDVLPMPPAQSWVCQAVDMGLGRSVQTKYRELLEEEARSPNFDEKTALDPERVKARIREANRRAGCDASGVPSNSKAEAYWRAVGAIPSPRKEEWVGNKHFGKELEKELPAICRRQDYKNWDGGMDGTWHNHAADCPPEYLDDEERGNDKNPATDVPEGPVLDAAASDDDGPPLPPRPDQSRASTPPTSVPFDPKLICDVLKYDFVQCGTPREAQELLFHNHIRNRIGVLHGVKIVGEEPNCTVVVGSKEVHRDLQSAVKVLKRHVDAADERHEKKRIEKHAAAAKEKRAAAARAEASNAAGKKKPAKENATQRQPAQQQPTQRPSTQRPSTQRQSTGEARPPLKGG